MKLYRIDDSTVTTTVGELIEALQKCDPNAYVYTEGCDCTGNATDIDTSTEGQILICRDDEALVWGDGFKAQFVADKYKDRVTDVRVKK